MKHEYCFLSERTVDSVIHQLKKHGISVIQNYLSAKLLQNLNAEFEQLLIETTLCIKAQFKHPTNIAGRVARVDIWHESSERYPSMQATFRDDFMRHIADNYYGPHPFSFNEEVHVTHEFPCKVQILPWHFDRIQSLKFWFYLQDTTKADGAFEYCPGVNPILS